MATIYAVSSGRPPAAISIIRISGPAANAAATALAGRLPAPRQAGLRRLRDEGGAVLDEALVLVFPGPLSATGEDVVELHCHGGRAVVAAVERALARQPGLRTAEPGEFTRRALSAGRIDLAEAQGLADLLAAETEAQRVAAVSAAEGRVSRAVKGWMDRLAHLSAGAEALLDFAEEDEVASTAEGEQQLATAMTALSAEIAAVLATPSVDRLRNGIGVVLAGPPNAGKSTLLNLLAQREAAIVSPLAGTTRDRIEVAVQRAGLPFLLTDTAGLAERTADVIEAIGIDRARAAMARADLVLWLGDERPPQAQAIWVHARADLPGRGAAPGRDIAVSAHDWESIEALWDLVVARVQRLVPRPDSLAIDEAQRRWCAIARDALATEWSDLLVGAELLRQAHSVLATLLGKNATEAMLDALFGKFCLGK